MDRTSAWPSRVLALGALLLNLTLTGCSDPTAPAPLKITSVSPAAGPLAGGTAITITGARFRRVDAVTVGGTPLENLAIVSTTQLTGLTPAGLVPGAVDVVVEGDGETRADAQLPAALPAGRAVAPDRPRPSAGLLRRGTVT